MPGWAPPGIAADSDVTRFNLRKGWLLPGDKGSAGDPEVILPPGFDPRMRGQGVQVVVSPPGTAPPPVGIHYQPRNGRVYGPEEHPQSSSLTLSVVPAIGGAPTDPTMQRGPMPGGIPPGMPPGMMPPQGGPPGPPMMPRGVPGQGPPPMMGMGPGHPPTAPGGPPMGGPPTPMGSGPPGAGQDIGYPQGTLRPKPKTAVERQRITDLPQATPVQEPGPPVSAQNPDPSPASPMQLGIQEIIQQLVAAAGIGGKNSGVGQGQDSPYRVGAGASREGVDQNSIPTLDPAAAAAFCGPAALLFMIQMHRPPTAEEAQALRQNAEKSGWTPGAGMGGPGAFSKLAKQYGVNLATVPNDPNEIAKHLQAGQPIVVSTPGHYWQLGDYDQKTQKFLAVDTVGRNRWLTLDDIQKDKYGGPIQAAWAAPGSEAVGPRSDSSGMANVPENVRGQIIQVAQEVGVDPALFAALLKQESGFRQEALSPAGARGIAQLMPATARGLGVSNIDDLMENLKGGAKFLKQLLDQRHGNIEEALSMYNSGRPDAYTDAVPKYEETKKYVPLVMKNYEEFKKGGTGPPSGSGFAQIDARPDARIPDLSGGQPGMPQRVGPPRIQNLYDPKGQQPQGIRIPQPNIKLGGAEFGGGAFNYGSGQDTRVGSGQGEGLQHTLQILQRAAAQVARTSPQNLQPDVQNGKIVGFRGPSGMYVPIDQIVRSLVTSGTISMENAQQILAQGGVPTGGGNEQAPNMIPQAPSPTEQSIVGQIGLRFPTPPGGAVAQAPQAPAAPPQPSGPVSGAIDAPGRFQGFGPTPTEQPAQSDQSNFSGQVNQPPEGVRPILGGPFNLPTGAAPSTPGSGLPGFPGGLPGTSATTGPRVTRDFARDADGNIMTDPETGGRYQTTYVDGVPSSTSVIGPNGEVYSGPTYEEQMQRAQEQANLRDQHQLSMARAMQGLSDEHFGTEQEQARAQGLLGLDLSDEAAVRAARLQNQLAPNQYNTIQTEGGLAGGSPLGGYDRIPIRGMPPQTSYAPGVFTEEDPETHEIRVRPGPFPSGTMAQSGQRFIQPQINPDDVSSGNLPRPLAIGPGPVNIAGRNILRTTPDPNDPSQLTISPIGQLPEEPQYGALSASPQFRYDPTTGERRSVAPGLSIQGNRAITTTLDDQGNPVINTQDLPLDPTEQFSQNLQQMEMDLRQKEFDLQKQAQERPYSEMTKEQAAQLGLSYAQLQQQRQDAQEARQQHSQEFQQTMGLQQQQLGLQREQVEMPQNVNLPRGGIGRINPVTGEFGMVQAPEPEQIISTGTGYIVPAGRSLNIGGRTISGGPNPYGNVNYGAALGRQIGYSGGGSNPFSQMGGGSYGNPFGSAPVSNNLYRGFSSFGQQGPVNPFGGGYGY